MKLSKCNAIWIHSIEPVGSVAPKANLDDELKLARVRIEHDLSLAVNVQGYPVPSYLWVLFPIFLRKELFEWFEGSKFEFQSQHSC